MIEVVKIETYKRRKEQYSMNPTKFTLWVFLITITMLFGAFTSAMVVSRTDAIENGFWQYFELPFTFTISTIIIVVSSISMQWAHFAAKRNELPQVKIALGVTAILGLSFLYAQYSGYIQLLDSGVYLSGRSNAGAYFYIISGIHGLHVVGGIIFVMANLYSALRFRVHSKSMLRINLCTTYWHFIGALWIYLFALLNIVR